MKKEKSCGAIVYITENNTLKFLMIHMNQGHFSFPKGHVEPNENEFNTASREVKEETNIDIEFVEGFREVATYQPAYEVTKDVVFFLAKATSFDLKIQTEELQSAGFYTKEEIRSNITFDTDQIIFSQALKFMEEHYLLP